MRACFASCSLMLAFHDSSANSQHALVGATFLTATSIGVFLFSVCCYSAKPVVSMFCIVLVRHLLVCVSSIFNNSCDLVIVALLYCPHTCAGSQCMRLYHMRMPTKKMMRALRKSGQIASAQTQNVALH